MTKMTTSTPHDAVFKQFLYHPDTARDFLDIYLPSTLRELCDLQTLPLVIPMLFYHGALSPYPFSLCWLDEFDDPIVARQLYSATFPLVDITVIPDDEIMQHRRIALLELMQKHIRKRDLMGLVEQLVSLLATGYANDSQLKTLFNYMMQFGNTPHIDKFIREVAQRVPQQKESLMTIAEVLQQEAKQQEALRIAQMMLANGISHEIILKITGCLLRISSPGRLLHTEISSYESPIISCSIGLPAHLHPNIS